MPTLARVAQGSKEDGGMGFIRAFRDRSPTMMMTLYKSMVY